MEETIIKKAILREEAARGRQGKTGRKRRVKTESRTVGTKKSSQEVGMKRNACRKQ